MIDSARAKFTTTFILVFDIDSLIKVGIIGITALTALLIYKIGRVSDTIFANSWWRFTSEVSDRWPWLLRFGRGLDLGGA